MKMKNAQQKFTLYMINSVSIVRMVWVCACIHSYCSQIQTECREMAPLGPSALPKGSGSPDRRLCADPCPPATEVHLPC